MSSAGDFNPYEPSSIESATAPQPVSDVEKVRLEHQRLERSIKGVGGVQMLGGILLTLSGLSSFSGSINPDYTMNEASVAIALFFLLVGIALLATGFRLRKLDSRALIPSRVLAIVGLFAFPLGTIFNVIFLFTLFNGKTPFVLSDEYKEVIAQTPGVKAKTSRGAMIGLILLVAFCVGLVILTYVNN